MKVNIKPITGAWNKGFALDKHTVSSRYIGDDENGRAQFDTVRTEVGEAVFQLKYRSGWGNVSPLATAMASAAKSQFGKVDVIVPMPASTQRTRQPVTELATEIGRQLARPVATTLLQKLETPQLKNLNLREEKDAVLAGAFSIHDTGTTSGSFDVLLVDDVLHTGASLDAACRTLRKWGKLNRLYVAVLTWR